MIRFKLITFSFIKIIILFCLIDRTINLQENVSPSLLASALESNSHEIIGSYFKKKFSPINSAISVMNLSAIVGKTVHLNCSLFNSGPDPGNKMEDFFKSRQSDVQSEIKLNPTWLKADRLYNAQDGQVLGYKTENIIVTRKGIISDIYRDKLKLISVGNQLQILRISDIDIKDEGKYICREFNSYDKLFYLNVYSPIKELSISFSSQSKYFKDFHTGPPNHENQKFKFFPNNGNGLFNKINKTSFYNPDNYDANTISIRENDELTVNCVVNSSKPAANLTIWIKKRTTRRSLENHNLIDDRFDTENGFGYNDDFGDFRRLDIYESQTNKNKDNSLKTMATSKFTVSRSDNHKLISCVAENTPLNEKWETKRVLNVLYPPKCSKYQKTVYNTGINQSIELECHMSEANPPYLDFTWSFGNAQPNKERLRSNGFLSRINWTPRSEKDFGDITCIASNGLDFGECKLKLQLGGAPNPPFDCYHKENNKTIIIECKPGFDQGDPEVYFYLLKKKSNGVLVEYARKRDSCSFLISNFILEEHINEFFIYSSNKYGNNKDKSTKISIENRDFLLRNSNKLQDISADNTKRYSMITGIGGVCLLFLVFMCCMISKCKSKDDKGSSLSSGSSHYTSNRYTSSSTNTMASMNTISKGYSNNKRSSLNLMHYQEPYKYSAHQNQYHSKSNVHHVDYGNVYMQGINKTSIEDKANFNSSNGSSSEFEKDSNGIYDNSSFKKTSYSKLSITKSLRSPSLLNNIQDLDMSPKSKRRSLEKAKESYSCSRSLIDETTETDSDNYSEFNKTKNKNEQFCEQFVFDNQKSEIYYNSNSNLNGTVANNEKLNLANSSNLFTLGKARTNELMYSEFNNVNSNQSNDDYSGISVDRPFKYGNSNSNLSNINSTLKRNELKNNYDSGSSQNNNYYSAKHREDNNKGLMYSLAQKASYDQMQNSDVPLFANETISLDVDDEKIVGILV